ncbi:nickel pincer cofactor biosynthesis protein LarB [Nitrososphaera viennensis]|uniref:Nickel pincer cofactor biosynthesis protein LarB n=2 Tax=Nitrososphaera viennensis TaxID=1034015 RepID=A0A977IGW9_9ARCH|nr:nickel pincer cofactor biosynthesis protein LarB [Nitrososphaera viennensis]AIC15633.1 putative 1-(5-phosphoribosyl)-5-amino-4-imidazole-carboxylate (AIR) carboxylase [Nitrososphaera viennensis EN76]UVS70508.1 nickel pincer cofactor biosynthesis protein LarB [Nitrososphaera viennensis]
MDLRTILEKFAKGAITAEEAQKEISIHAIEHVDNIAKLDVGREMRKGLPEIVFAERKEYADTLRIAQAAVKRNGRVVVSRVKKKDLAKLVSALKKKGLSVEVGRNSTTIIVANTKSQKQQKEKALGRVGIMAAGTSDIGVAEEARLVAEAMGCDTITSYDIGIAGMHRVFPSLKEMLAKKVGAIVVVAGMEGALASVVASMVDVPVVGVPTSVGYGFGADGIAALASMLQSCTLGLAVVNIDNGVGAGAFAASVAKSATRQTR